MVTIGRQQGPRSGNRADIAHHRTDAPRQLLFDGEGRISASRNDRKAHRGVVEPVTLICGIRCSTDGTPPSAKITRYFALRCCPRTSR
jgi:hypothetical protein